VFSASKVYCLRRKVVCSMVQCRKRPYTVFGLNTTKGEESIVVKDDRILAVDSGDAKQQFTIKHAEVLSPVAGNLEVFVSPFCG